jgi:DNA-binding MarR family transcriptional regulator
MIDGLDPVIHVPKRLAAMAILANAPSVSFRFLKEQLQLADSDLSKQMSALEAAGYVKSTKDGHGRGASTTFSMTRAGRKAYAAHCAALRALIDSVPAPDR